MTHCFLHLLVNPKVDEGETRTISSVFTVIAYNPRLGLNKPWGYRTPYLIVPPYADLHIKLFKYPLLLLNGFSGKKGVIQGRHLRALVSAYVFAPMFVPQGLVASG